MHWQPSSGPDTARRRAERLAVVRQFFAERDVLEVDVPGLSTAAGCDPNIESLRVTTNRGRPLFLQTSPEFAMKRLLAGGYPDIFCIARVFRDGEIGRMHEPEFTLVEWYRQGFDLAALAAETCALIAGVLERTGLGRTTETLRYEDAFKRHAGIDPLQDGIDRLAECAAADASLRQALGDDRDAWLDLLLCNRVVPAFDQGHLTVLSHYPASQAALARLDPDDARYALRFEVFLGRVELANGYVELLDVTEQKRRFAHEQALRERRGQPVLPIDRRLLAALEHGLPDCAGVALGFERLHMLYEGVDDIARVLTLSSGQDQ
ncbi:MAG: EF-P lysine aminoacylase EpmA [Pseudomonadota bacterium]